MTNVVIMIRHRLTYIFKSSIIILAFISCSADNNATKQSEKEENTKSMEVTKPYLAHTVYFWLKEGTSEEDKIAFEKGLAKLGTVPNIQSFYWGAPASTEKRDVVDSSFDYAINSLFTSLENQLIYQEHPIHLEFIENHSHIWETVKVYDNVTH